MNPIEEAELSLNEMELAGFIITRRKDIPRKEQRDTIAYLTKNPDSWRRAYLKYSNRAWQVGFPQKVERDEGQEEDDLPTPASARALLQSLGYKKDSTYIWLEYGSPEAAVKRIKRWLLER